MSSDNSGLTRKGPFINVLLTHTTVIHCKALTRGKSVYYFILSLREQYNTGIKAMGELDPQLKFKSLKSSKVLC